MLLQEQYCKNVRLKDMTRKCSCIYEHGKMMPCGFKEFEMTRDLYVDVAKGISILLIVAIHTEVFGKIGNPLAFIAVPVFFFMSGFYDRSEKELKTWFPKALKTLLLPAFIWVMLVTMYVQFLGFLKDRSWGEFPFDWYHVAGKNGPAWFLFALLYAKSILWGLRKTGLPKLIIGGASLAIGYLGMNVDMPLYLNLGCAALPLYAAGKYGYPYMQNLLVSKHLLLLGTIALLTYCCGYVSFTIVPQGTGLYAPFYIVALAAMVLVFIPFLYVAEKFRGQKWLGCLGRHSLGVMLVHAPMCHTAAIVLNRSFAVGSPSWIACFLITYVLIVFVAYQLTILIERYCPLLLGKSDGDKC